MFPYATLDDVEALLGESMDAPTQGMATYLLRMAGNLMRAKVATIDARIAAYDASTTPPTGLDPQSAADINAGMVVRVLRNPDLVTAETIGPSSATYSKLSGQLTITPDEVLILVGPAKRPTVGTMRLEPALAPKFRPFGRPGPVFDRPRRDW